MKERRNNAMILMGCMLIGLMIPLALSPRPLIYIIGFMVWCPIVYILELGVEDGEGRHT